MNPRACPNEEVLSRYAVGEMTEGEADTIDAHIGSCTICLTRLDRVAKSPDSLIQALRVPADVPHDPPALVRVVAAVLSDETAVGGVASPAPTEGSLLAGYRIVEEIGRGGMGRVYRAIHPRTGQEVALKVLRPGMDSAPILARFEAERQALSLMEHPHIARVTDGGVTDDGRPFFVMELVKGTSITRYYQERGTSLRDRLELFILVCQAVQHAHQKGIIHRDLKPSNVLVAEFDGKPVPKVIDFGVAKAVDRRVGSETEVGMIVGTPEYMSPEQADLTSHDIDTRSDIYALGVILYELLTHDTPISRARLRDTPILEVLRIIRKEDAVPPSVRIAETTRTNSAFDSDPTKAARQIRGELDWIVLKALEKDRSRRYETAGTLAEDIRSFLADEPVRAGPPTRTYRLRKFVQRNRLAVVAATVVLAALLLGTGGTTYGMFRARQAEGQAVDERNAARAVSNFLANDLLAMASVYNQSFGNMPRDPDVKLRTLLDRAAANIEGKFDGQPLAEAQLRHVIGQVYNFLGDPTTGRRHLEHARELNAFPPGSTELHSLVSDLSLSYFELRDFERTEQLTLELIDMLRREVGSDNEKTLLARSNLAMLYRMQDKNAEALQMMEELLAQCMDRLGPDNKTTLQVQHNLGDLMKHTGEYGRAEAMFAAALEGRRRLLGPDHPMTINAIQNLASAYEMQRKYQDAERMLNEALEANRRLHGPDHSHTLSTLHELGNLCISLNQLDRAELHTRDAWERRRKTLGTDHAATLDSRLNLATILAYRGQFDEAAVAYGDLSTAFARVLGPRHSRTLTVRNNLASVYLRQRKYSEAEVEFRKLLEVLREDPAPKWEVFRAVLNSLAEVLVRQSKWVEAEPMAREFHDRCREKEPNSVAYFSAKSLLGLALAELNRYEEAEPFLNDGYRGMVERQGQLSPQMRSVRINEAVQRLVRLYELWGRTDQAAEWKAKLIPLSPAKKPM